MSKHSEQEIWQAWHDLGPLSTKEDCLIIKDALEELFELRQEKELASHAPVTITKDGWISVKVSKPIETTLVSQKKLPPPS